MRNHPYKITYQMPYPDGLVEQVVLFNTRMRQYDPFIKPITDEQQKDIDTAVGRLSENEQKVIRKHYEEHVSKKEIAELYGVSYSKVCEFHNSGIRHLVKMLSEM